MSHSCRVEITPETGRTWGYIQVGRDYYKGCIKASALFRKEVGATVSSISIWEYGDIDTSRLLTTDLTF